MGLLKTIIKASTRDIRAQAHGVQGERKVNAKLNPLIFGKVEHKQINNLVLLDEYGKSHQIDHIEIRENGIFCIETKNYIGWIFGSENSDKWTQTLFTGEKHQFYNPLKQNKTHCYHISKVVGRKYTVNSLVVMANDNADKIGCPNVINIKDLKKYLKNFDNGVHLTSEEMESIYNQLMNAASDISNREHVKNIKETQKAIEHNICPRCGGSLVLRKGKNGEFFGCNNYPKCKFIKNK